jgi:DNA polymerase-1
MLGRSGEGTDEKILETVDHPIAELILEWRSNNKRLSTYVKPLMVGFGDVVAKVDEPPTLFADGKIHPILSTTKTRTWRTSSDSVNSQNFPKREHREIRSQIKPAKGYKVVAFDYGQIQARNVAMESLDKVLVQAFWDRYDIHSDWMERIADAYPKWVEGGVSQLKDKDIRKKYRDRAKNEFVFPSFFGAQPKSLAKYLGLPESIVASLSNEFYSIFSGLRAYHKRIIKDYNELGYVTGHSGFRRRAPISPNELINAPIQADEATIVLDAMSRLSEMGEDRFQANLEIHDDLTFIWPEDEIEENAKVVIRAMLDVPFKWAKTVPILVEMAIGDDWASTRARPEDEFSSDTWDGTIAPLGEGRSGGKAKGNAGAPEKEKAAQRRPERLSDPNKGSWDDGTGWANHDHGMENVTRRRLRGKR